MSSGLAGFLELTFENETGDDLVDHFHLSAAQEPDGTISHISDGDVESWKREGRPVGKGGFGIAWLERDVKGNTRVIKEVKKVIPGVKTRYWIRELSAMALLSKNKTGFPHFYGWFQDESYVYIAMEHFSLGDLHDCVNKSLPCDQASVVIGQVSCALDIMHRRRITHRDLKPANVLVRHGPPEWQVAVCDFGVSKRIRGITTALHTAFDGDFMAPEILGFVDNGTSGEYSSAVDMWSLGCLAYWLLKMKMPVPRHKMMAHCRRPWPDAANNIETTDIDEAGKDFIFSLLRPEPQQRLTALQARSHGWLEAYSTRTSIPAPTPATTNIKERYVSQKLTENDLHKHAQALISFPREQNRISSVPNNSASVTSLKSQENKPPVGPILLEKHVPFLPSAEPSSSLLRKQRVCDGNQLPSSSQTLYEASDINSDAGEPKALRAQKSDIGQLLRYPADSSVESYALLSVTEGQVTEVGESLEGDPDNYVLPPGLIAKEEQPRTIRSTVSETSLPHRLESPTDLANQSADFEEGQLQREFSSQGQNNNQEGVVSRTHIDTAGLVDTEPSKQAAQPENSILLPRFMERPSSLSADLLQLLVYGGVSIKTGYVYCSRDMYSHRNLHYFLVLKETCLHFYKETWGINDKSVLKIDMYRIVSVKRPTYLVPGFDSTQEFEIYWHKHRRSEYRSIMCRASSDTEADEWVRCIENASSKYEKMEPTRM